MNLLIRCSHCGRFFHPNPRVKNQRYCSEQACQRARKRLWQKHKLASDPDYQANQRRCKKEWQIRNPHYYKRYRTQHADYVKRNQLLQRCRNGRRRVPQMIAKMDASASSFYFKPGTYYLSPDHGQEVAKMDALTAKIILIPTSYA